MFLLGLLLLGATGAFTGLLIAYNSGGGPVYTVTLFGNNLGTLSARDVFLAGIALTLVFLLSLVMTFAGAAALGRRRAARRAERRDAAGARAERDALAARLKAGRDQESEREKPRDTEAVAATRGPFTPPSAPSAQ